MTTKEGLKQEAEEYVRQNYCDLCVMVDDCKSGCIDCFTVQAYLAGAEPREKRIAELERFIKTQDRKLRQQSEECDKAINRVETLVKENAELKADNDARKFAMAMSEKVEKKLRQENKKAKELLKKMSYEYQRLCLIKKETIAEAEQFLNKVEK